MPLLLFTENSESNKMISEGADQLDALTLVRKRKRCGSGFTDNNWYDNDNN